MGWRAQHAEEWWRASVECRDDGIRAGRRYREHPDRASAADRDARDRDTGVDRAPVPDAQAFRVEALMALREQDAVGSAV